MTAHATALPGARPTALLPWRQLTLISVYWFGINVVWGAYEGFGQKQVELIVGSDSVGLTLGFLELLGGLVAVVTVPTVGAISDYTTSRFGRRKGYIITGTSLDLLFITGLSLVAMAEPEGWDGSAIGTTALMGLYAVLFLGLQFSSNLAQGPYQGLVPDLVAEPQVGLASGLVGVMRTVGLVAGFAVMAVGAAVQLWGLAFLAVGILEFVLAIGALYLALRSFSYAVSVILGDVWGWTRDRGEPARFTWSDRAVLFVMEHLRLRTINAIDVDPDEGVRVLPPDPTR